MIKLTKLELKNFLSHVDTSLDLTSYSGLVLIEGITSDGHYSSNGAGKSTILEGIVYALTGDTLRGISVNDVVNRNHMKNTRVSLSFLKDDESYTVIRYRKDDSMGDSLVFMKGEEDISKRVNKETQKIIEDTLGISYKILVSTVLLGEGLSAKFTQLSDPEKKSLIESTLNLNYDLNKIRDIANKKLKDAKLREAKVLGEIEVLESMRGDDLELLEDSIKDNEKCIEIYEATIEEINQSVASLSSYIESTLPKINMIRDSINQSQTIASQLAALSETITHYEEETDKILHSEIPVCALCHQSLSSHGSKESVINNYKSKIDESLSEKSILDSKLSGLPDVQVLNSKLTELTTKYNDALNDSRTKMQEINSYNIKITEARNNIGRAKEIIANAQDCGTKLKQKLSDKSDIHKEIAKYDYFYKLFSPTGIIVNILSEAINYINTRLSIYSEILLEKDYSINFLKGKISLVDSKGSSYQSLSNGEKRRLDIAIQFSLHDYVHIYCGLKIDTLFVDEILDTLDDIGVDNIFDVLRLKLDYCHLNSIYVITHNNSLKDKFDKVITVKKEENGDSILV